MPLVSSKETVPLTNHNFSSKSPLIASFLNSIQGICPTYASSSDNSIVTSSSSTSDKSISTFLLSKSISSSCYYVIDSRPCFALNSSAIKRMFTFGFPLTKSSGLITLLQPRAKEFSMIISARLTSSGSSRPSRVHFSESS